MSERDKYQLLNVELHTLTLVIQYLVHSTNNSPVKTKINVLLNIIAIRSFYQLLAAQPTNWSALLFYNCFVKRCCNKKK